MSSTLKNIVKQTKLKGCSKKKKETVKEPVRKTLYDVLVQNLGTANRKTFLHRLIYAGYHDFGIACEKAVQIFSKIVSNTNNRGGLELLTGIYLHYPNHFVHIVEADEDSINNHLNLLFSNGEAKNFRGMKVIVNLNHITERLVQDWSNYEALPKTLLNPPIRTENETEADTACHVFSCVIRLHKLIEKINITQPSTARESSSILKKPSHDISLIKPPGDRGPIEPSSSMLKFRNLRTSAFHDTPSFAMSAQVFSYRDFIPEAELLDYILTSPYSMDLREYFDLFGFVLQRSIYKDKVWPIPSDFIPYNVFESEYERRVDMFEKVYENAEGDEHKTAEVDLEEENEPKHKI